MRESRVIEVLSLWVELLRSMMNILLLSVHLCVRLSVSGYPFIHLSAHPSVRPSICLFVYLCMSVCILLYLLRCHTGSCVCYVHVCICMDGWTDVCMHACLLVCFVRPGVYLSDGVSVSSSVPCILACFWVSNVSLSALILIIDLLCIM